MIKFPPTKIKFAKDLDDAYEKGFFQGAINLDEIIERVQKKSPEIVFHYSQGHVGLWRYGKFLMGLVRMRRIPKFSILKLDPKFDKSAYDCTPEGEKIQKITHNFDPDKHKPLARGWYEVFRMLSRKGIDFDEKDLI